MSAHADAIAIRAATGDDAASIAPLLTSLGYPAAPADVRRRLDRLLADAAVRCLVATDGPNTIGFATLHILRIAHADDPVGMITALVVDPRARGRGAGRALVLALEDFARLHRCPRVLVTSAEHRADAHAFYLRLGYQPTGRRFGRTLQG